MRASIERRLSDALAESALAGRIAAAARPLLERRGDDAALQRLDGPVLVGLARAIATQPETASFLSHRPALLERLAEADAKTLDRQSRALAAWGAERDDGDLETALDSLRLRRREETCIAACLDHSGLVPFESVSTFLSILAESIAQRALGLARRAASAGPTPLGFAVIGMGKIAGREFTYHSDLDLLFLYEGGPEAVDDASRVGQRLISYLTTMTGAGVAYAVDTRLRPSGRQGMLVTSLPAFERYQCEQAQTWEHVAMLRARAIAGSVEAARQTLERVCARILAEHPPPWGNLVGVRRRVESERADESAQKIPLKTGAGGLMDVDFLAGGGLLERRPEHLPELPSVPAMLRAAVRGRRVEELLEEYALLRRAEANARWMAGRAVDAQGTHPDALTAAAELAQPGTTGAELRKRLTRARERIREAYDRVMASGTIAALEN
jgi:glutamate-ammonia-ligase adenylyltransferase